MTKIEKLEETINQAQKELQELKAESVKNINYFQPKENETYWYVGVTGDALSMTDFGCNKYRVFKTKEEAEKYEEYIKAEETLREAIALGNDGWLPDWSDDEEIKFFIMRENNKLDFTWCAKIKSQPSFMYIKSQELTEKLMKDYEAEYLTYLSY